MPDRPFYGEYAWAYDWVLARPASGNSDFIAELLSRRGVLQGSLVLDAGCGTGGYVLELERLGYSAVGLDLSEELLSEARRRLMSAGRASPALVRADLLSMPFGRPLDAILCRGVLNDLLEDGERLGAFESFAGHLRPGGALVLDVREWEGTVRRKRLEPSFETTAETPRGLLTFRSHTRLDAGRRRLLVSEQHVLKTYAGETVSVHEFVMRCWTREELEEKLELAGFKETLFLGAYRDGVRAGSTDRLVVSASRL